MNYLKTNLKNVTSILMLLTCVAMMALCLNSCNKGEDPFKNGGDEEIPGLGNAEGELTGTPFKLPDGIELTGNITGAGYQNDYWILYTAPSERKLVHKDGTVEDRVAPIRTRVDEESNYRGSGYGYVDLLIPLRNTRLTPVEVTIPAATIIVSQSGECQHGVLIKKVTFTIPANGSYRLILSLYCGNLSKSSAYSSDIYVWGVVSNAKALLDLCDRVKNKKINIEEFSRTSNTDYNVYEDQVDELQSIVWEITDFSGKLSDDDIRYINSLPNSN